jgi:chemotaxis family two-component system sensor kinase Cph1
VTPYLDDDERQRLVGCVREPIRTPGSIQPHGALVAIDTSTGEIVHASQNLSALLGVDASTVLGRHLSSVTGEAWIATHDDTLFGGGGDGAPLPFSHGGESLDVLVHRTGAHTVVEFEPSLPAEAHRSTSAVFGAIRRLGRLTSRQELWTSVARELRRLTGFDRVMVYHFHPDDHGEIVAEERADEMEPYLGLHYPASDIPAQARELYLSKHSRTIVDSAGDVAELLSLDARDRAPGSVPLDLSGAELRSVSPHHLQFMRNMGQVSTLSLSLIVGDRLIGMITLAHRSRLRVPYTVRQALEILAAQVGLQLGAMAEIDRLTIRADARAIRARVVGQLETPRQTGFPALVEALLLGHTTVLDLIPADGSMLHFDGETDGIGTLPSELALAAAAIRRHLPVSGVLCTDELGRQHPELADSLPAVTGLLAVPLGSEGDFVAWMRPELIHDVRWLGDQTAANRQSPLSPRDSFSSWSQSVSGVSAPWGGADVDALELARDLTDTMLRHAEGQLAALALHDALTGLPNRRELDRRLHSAAVGGGEVSVLFIDLDSFKAINDTYGHDAGDSLLVHAADRITGSLRTGDAVARLDDDEFVVVCEGVGAHEAHVIARRIVAAISRPVTVGDDVFSVTASVGVATGQGAIDTAVLVKDADRAMYRAKSRGGNRLST